MDEFRLYVSVEDTPQTICDTVNECLDLSETHNVSFEIYFKWAEKDNQNYVGEFEWDDFETSVYNFSKIIYKKAEKWLYNHLGVPYVST